MKTPVIAFFIIFIGLYFDIVDSQKLINAPWQQSDYIWDYTKNPNLIWLDNYREILDYVKNIPDTELENFSGNPEMFFSLCYLNFSNLDNMAKFQDLENAKEISVFYSGFYPNISANFLAYYIRPILKECYGVDAVFFTDYKQLNGSNGLNFGIDDTAFNSVYSDIQSDVDRTVEVFKNPLSSYNNSRTGNCWIPANMDANGDFKFAIDTMKSVCARTNTPYIYSDLFLINYLATVDMELQRYLGLR